MCKLIKTILYQEASILYNHLLYCKCKHPHILYDSAESKISRMYTFKLISLLASFKKNKLVLLIVKVISRHVIFSLKFFLIIKSI